MMFQLEMLSSIHRYLSDQLWVLCHSISKTDKRQWQWNHVYHCILTYTNLQVWNPRAAEQALGEGFLKEVSQLEGKLLDEADLTLICAYALKINHGLTNDAYNSLCFLFPQTPLDSLKNTEKRWNAWLALNLIYVVRQRFIQPQT